MREDPYFGRMVVWMKPAVSEIIRYDLRSFELFLLNKTKNPALISLFLPNSEQKQTKNRLTMMSSGPFL